MPSKIVARPTTQLIKELGLNYILIYAKRALKEDENVVRDTHTRFVIIESIISFFS